MVSLLKIRGGRLSVVSFTTENIKMFMQMVFHLEESKKKGLLMASYIEKIKKICLLIVYLTVER